MLHAWYKNMYGLNFSYYHLKGNVINHNGKMVKQCVHVLTHFLHVYIIFCNSFCNVNSFIKLNILQHVWPIIRASRYRAIIFKVTDLLRPMTFIRGLNPFPQLKSKHHTSLNITLEKDMKMKCTYFL